MRQYKITVYYGGTEATLLGYTGTSIDDVASRFEANLSNSKWTVIDPAPGRQARVQNSSISHFVVWQ